MAPGRLKETPAEATIVVSADDRVMGLDEGARVWLGEAPTVFKLIDDVGFRAAVAKARASGQPETLELHGLRNTEGATAVRITPSGKLLVVALTRGEAKRTFRSLLETVAAEGTLEETLQSIVDFAEATTGLRCQISVATPTGALRSVTRKPTAMSPSWSWPLHDAQNHFKGVIEAFSPDGRPPSAVHTERLRETALVASLAVTKAEQVDEVRDCGERLQLVLGTTHHVLYDWDLVTDNLMWHARIGDAFGHWAATRDSSWWRDTIHPEDRERVDQALQQTIAGTESAWLQMYRFRRASGGWAWAQDAGRLQRDHAGRAIRLVGVMQDVTEQRDLRSRLALSERLASVGTLAAGVAHEINNPLAWITSNVNFALEEFEALRRQPRDLNEFIDDMIDALEDARAGAERVSVIVRDLKTFSRAQDERVGPIDVKRVLESAITMASNEIRHRAKLVRETRDVPAVDGNEGRLSQVFLNLLINAAQSMPESDATHHEIRVVTGVDPNGRVFVEIRDTGTGIAPDVLPRIFDPFFTTKPVGQGTGLGLSICHSIISSMSGTIEVHSQLGVGSTFRVVMPAKAALRPRASPAAPLSSASGQRCRIVVIDDEPGIIASIERVLASHHDVTGFTDARQALIAVTQQPPDVIFCDLMMPELSGPEFYARLIAKDARAASSVMFMTGGAFTQVAQAFLETVQPPLLEKPFKPEQLRQAVLERSRASSAARATPPKPLAHPAVPAAPDAGIDGG